LSETTTVKHPPSPKNHRHHTTWAPSHQYHRSTISTNVLFVGFAHNPHQSSFTSISSHYTINIATVTKNFNQPPPNSTLTHHRLRLPPPKSIPDLKLLPTSLWNRVTIEMGDVDLGDFMCFDLASLGSWLKVGLRCRQGWWWLCRILPKKKKKKLMVGFLAKTLSHGWVSKFINILLFFLF